MRETTAKKKNLKALPHTAEQLAMLNDIGRAMTALGEMDSVLNAIREQAQRILSFDAFIILLYSPETSIVSYPLVYDNGRNWSEPDRPLALDMHSHAVIKAGKPALINLTKKDFDESLKNQSRSLTGDYSQNYRSFLYAPLLRLGRAIGVVSTISYQFNAYTQEQLALLESIATQATIAIENARLYQAQQKEIAERKQAQEEIRKLNAELEQRVGIRTSQLQEANESLKIEKARLERYNRQREILARLTDLLQASQNKIEASEIVSKQLKLLFPEMDGALYLTNSSSMLEPATVWGGNKTLDSIFAADECWALRRGRHYLFGTDSENPSCPHVSKPIPQYALCIPLAAFGESLGSLHLQSNDKSLAMNYEEREFAGLAAESIAMALANLQLREKLRVQSTRDGLTGLFNRRYLDETLPREINRAERGNSHLSVLMFDIDHFKKFNDEYGHDAGDRILESMARVINASIRESDIACRYGGEEFIVILPDTSLEIAAKRAEKLRGDVSLLELEFNGKKYGEITISIGVATCPDHGATRETLVKSADEAAYRAKEKGRNCVVISGQPD